MLCKATPTVTERYVRIKIKTSTTLISVSIFGNGTLMFQGKGQEDWIKNNIDTICKSVKVLQMIYCILEAHKNETLPPNGVDD